MSDELCRREVLPKILDEMPPDPTSSEDMIYVSLCAGKPAKALSYAEKLDLWLAAHLADIMESVDLLEPKVDEECVLRAYFCSCTKFTTQIRDVTEAAACSCIC